MTWGAVAGAAVGVVGSAMSSGGGSQTNGGAGTTTSTKAPWLQATPWITNNMTSGQALQSQLADLRKIVQAAKAPEDDTTGFGRRQ